MKHLPSNQYMTGPSELNLCWGAGGLRAKRGKFLRTKPFRSVENAPAAQIAPENAPEKWHIPVGQLYLVPSPLGLESTGDFIDYYDQSTKITKRIQCFPLSKAYLYNSREFHT